METKSGDEPAIVLTAAIRSTDNGDYAQTYVSCFMETYHLFACRKNGAWKVTAIEAMSCATVTDTLTTEQLVAIVGCMLMDETTPAIDAIVEHWPQVLHPSLAVVESFGPR